MSNGFCEHREVKASRKRRRCYLCREFIEPGEPYTSMVGVTDGEFYREAGHPECMAKADDPDEWDWEECFSGDMERPKPGEHGRPES